MNQRMEIGYSSLTLICLVPFLSFGFFCHEISVEATTSSGCEFVVPCSHTWKSGSKCLGQKLKLRTGALGLSLPSWFSLAPSPPFLTHSPSSPSALSLPAMPSTPSCSLGYVTEAPSPTPPGILVNKSLHLLTAPH